MKTKLKEYLHIIGVSVLCFIFCLSLYYLIVNISHSKIVSKQVYVSSSDKEYINYSNNAINIKSNLDNYKYNKNKHKYDTNTMYKIYNNVNACYNLLSSNNSILGNKDVYVKYKDLYNLNNYLINSLIDKCFTTNLLWISNSNDSKLKENIIDSKYIVDMIANNSKYIKSILKDNSTYSFIRNDSNMLNNSYQFVLHNYSDFSKIVLDISNYLVNGE